MNTDAGPEEDQDVSNTTTVPGRVILEEHSRKYWHQYQIGIVPCPLYEVPYTSDEVSISLLNGYDKRRDLAVLNVILPFLSTPVWPLTPDTQEPNRWIFYYCAGDACGRPVAHIPQPEGYRVVVQMSVGTLTATGRAALGWVPPHSSPR